MFLFLQFHLISFALSWFCHGNKLLIFLAFIVSSVKKCSSYVEALVLGKSIKKKSVGQQERDNLELFIRNKDLGASGPASEF
ncbi:uncharacterized protein LOC107802854 isoform X2 [Nicotiana tabacum]|uniref:Uncharacterized protein LOC107802854 isoform X2 n=1 Tax=Nicotiana tabacum TaxID=4097 RepID=A0AC58UUS9_TOBAC